MRMTIAVTSVLVALSGTAPAFATSCAEQIATIERRLDSAGAASVTGSTGTQTGSPRALPTPPGGQPSDPGVKPDPQKIAQARALIAKAREQDKAGKADACEDTMTQAKTLIGALP
ncbi:hypothetical protein [Methylobacterium sp. WSM2598]|uniref:hypothetical protein n=1 Tax=Methylobacterium sp. WSM2598 TaxID=398261 RepID=UPI00036B111E|nr:hypothetical protein [Methylobacterium sp. WSM2598]